MHCPECQHIMTSDWLEPSAGLHCPHCGCHVIDPLPGLPLIVPRRARRAAPWLVAAAILLVLAAGAAALVWRGGRKRRPQRPAAVAKAERPAPPQVADRPEPSADQPKPTEPKPPADKPKAEQQKKDEKAKEKEREKPKPPEKPRPSDTPTAPDGLPIPTGQKEKDQRVREPEPRRRPPPPQPSGAGTPPGAGKAGGTAGGPRPTRGGAPRLALRPVIFYGLSAVTGIAFSPQQLKLASAHRDGSVRVWDMTGASDKPLVIKCESGRPLAVAFHPDGRHCAVMTANTVELFALPTGTWIGRIDSQAALSSMAISRSGEYLATAERDGAVVLRSLRSLRVTNRLASCGGTQALAWSERYGDIAVACADNAVRLWNPEVADAPRLLVGHLDWVSSIAIADAASRVVTGSWDATVRVWDRSTDKCTAVLRGHANRVTAVACTPGAEAVASGDDSGIVKVWSLRPPIDIATFHGHTGRVTGLVFVARNWVVSASEDGSARAWRVPPPPAIQPKTAKRYTDHIEAGARYTAAKQQGKAAAEYRAAAGLRPEYAEPHLLLAESLVAAGKPGDAVSSYRRALELNPECGWAWHRLGLCLLQAGHTNSGSTVLLKAREKFPALAMSRLPLAQALLAAKRYEAAAAEFAAELKQHLRSPEALLGLGQARAGQARWREAIDAFRRAIDLKRGYAPAYAGIVTAYLSMQPPQRDEAKAWAKLAESLGIQLPKQTQDRLDESN